MNANKGWGFAVAVLVTVLSSGCGAVTAGGVPAGSVVASGGATFVAADSVSAYRPAVVPEVEHHYTERASGPVARRVFSHP